MNRSRTRRIAASLVFLSSGLCAQSTVSPNQRALFEGNTSSPFPLGRANGRFQQIHADLGSTPRMITGHAYRADALGARSPIANFDVDLQIVLADAANSPAAASTTFANNVGGNSVAVLPRAMVSFPATTRPVTDPAPTFELRIPYSRPFAYSGNAPLLVDVVVQGNQTQRGPDLNFQAWLDAHESATDGRNDQPGYRFGSGCPAPGQSIAASARFTATRFLDGSLQLEIDARDGVPTTVLSPATSALVIGLGVQSLPWPLNPACVLHPTLDVAVNLPGANDVNGDWNGVLSVPSAIAAGQRFALQVVSGAPGAQNGDATFSDGSMLTIPPIGSLPIPAARVANSSDRDATTGTYSRSVTVTEFF